MVLEGTITPPPRLEGKINFIHGGSSLPLEPSVTIHPTTTSQTVEPSAGYYGFEKAFVTAVPIGNEGTPVASASEIEDNSITITPTVTNQNGFINGGTYTGTPLTISAEDLVSGELEIEENNTYDVTNYASAVVNVPGIVPSGELEITENNTDDFPAYDVTNYASVKVEVPNPSTGSITIVENNTYDVTELASVTVAVPTEIPDTPSAGNTPVDISGTTMAIIASADMTNTGISISIPKTGTYRFKYIGARTTVNNNITAKLYRTPSEGSPEAISGTDIVWETNNVGGYYTGDIACTEDDVITVFGKVGSSGGKIILGQLTASITWWKEGVD